MNEEVVSSLDEEVETYLSPSVDYIQTFENDKQR
jgi:hypothetical protein